MAFRELNQAVARCSIQQSKNGSDQFHRALVSWDEQPTGVPLVKTLKQIIPTPREKRVQEIAAERLLGQRRIVENLWQKFFSDPSCWWDNRAEKVNVRYPDFKHKQTQESLWLDYKFTPTWVSAELAAMEPGASQVDIFTWNKRLAKCVKLGQHEKTMELFWQMQKEGMPSDKFTFVPVLNACSKLRILQEGRRIHSQIIQAGHETDVYVGGALIDMYGKCGSIEDAEIVFTRMPVRDVVVWNSMICGYAKCGQGLKALYLSRQMQIEGVDPNTVTFVGMLNACACVLALEEGRHVHDEIIRRGWECVPFVSNSIIDMYAKCGSIEDAQSVFKMMTARNVVSWNAMIMGYVKCGQGKQALDLFRQMEVDPDPVTFVGVLNACASVGALEEGRYVHKEVINCGWESNVYLGCSLIDMYVKCGSVEDAQKVFNRISTRDVVIWNAMIQGLVECGQGRNALNLFQQMQAEGWDPNPVTFVGLLNACATISALEQGRMAHRQVIQRGWESHIFVGNSLIDMYAKCGSIEDAENVFKKISTRDVVSWNSMISGLLKCGQAQKALDLFGRIEVEPDSVTFVAVLSACASIGALKEGQRIHKLIIQRGLGSDVVLGNSIIDMYAKCGSMENAKTTFNMMPVRNIISWNAMIFGHVKSGQGVEALNLFWQMEREGVDANPITFAGVLSACASVSALDEGRRVHKELIGTDCNINSVLGSSLIDMYAKCGSVEDAEEVFETITPRDGVAWNAMLAGYAKHGLSKEALGHFERMFQEGVDMDEVTFLSLLSACNHGGLVNEGLHYFGLISLVYNVSPTMDHYACTVDLLGRAGRLHEGEDLIETMSMEPNASVWMSLLGACRVHENLEMGERSAKHVLELDPDNAAGYVLMSNIYAAAGKWKTSAKVQKERLVRRVKKIPGRTGLK